MKYILCQLLMMVILVISPAHLEAAMLLPKSNATTVDFKTPSDSIIKIDSQIITFLPDGYVLHDVKIGDLNKDNLIDYVLIVKATDKDAIVENRFNEIVDRNRRGIVILLNQGGEYTAVVSNLKCFSSENEDGGVYFAPELNIEITSKCNLKILYTHGRYGFWGYTFRYQNNAFQLIGYDNTSSMSGIPHSSVSINFLTKKKLNAININAMDETSETVRWKNSWEDINVDKLYNLQEVADFDEFISF